MSSSDTSAGSGGGGGVVGGSAFPSFFLFFVFVFFCVSFVIGVLCSVFCLLVIVGIDCAAMLLCLASVGLDCRCGIVGYWWGCFNAVVTSEGWLCWGACGMSLSLLWIGVLACVSLGSSSLIVDAACIASVGLINCGQVVLVMSMWSVGSS